MRLVFATTLLLALVSTSFADDKKKKDDKDEQVHCLIVQAAGKDVSPPVEVDYTSKFRSKTKVAMTPVAAKALCKSESNKPASEWVRDNGHCNGPKSTWKYTVAFGLPGKEEKFEQNVICARKK